MMSSRAAAVSPISGVGLQAAGLLYRCAFDSIPGLRTLVANGGIAPAFGLGAFSDDLFHFRAIACVVGGADFEAVVALL